MNNNKERLEELKEIIGPEHYDAVICRFAGERLYIPQDAVVNPRNQRIRDEYDILLARRIGPTRAIAHLAKKHHVSESWIRKIIRKWTTSPR